MDSDYLAPVRDFLVGDSSNSKSKGSVNEIFLRRGVCGSLGGTKTRILTISAVFVSQDSELIAQCFNIKRMATTASLRVRRYWVGCTRLDWMLYAGIGTTRNSSIIWSRARFAASCSQGQFSMRYSGGSSDGLQKLVPQV